MRIRGDFGTPEMRKEMEKEMRFLTEYIKLLEEGLYKLHLKLICNFCPGKFCYIECVRTFKEKETKGTECLEKIKCCRHCWRARKVERIIGFAAGGELIEKRDIWW